MTKRIAWRSTLAAALLCIGLTSALSAATQLSETGSTLMYPMMTLWIEGFEHSRPEITISADATGSGVGISEALAGRAEIGASDAYLREEQLKAQHALNIPLAVSAQEIAYNIPELHGTAPLHLTGAILADIYTGRIAAWDDRKIREANPGRLLPHATIAPVRRSDGSGDTFIFTQFLTAADPGWEHAVGFGTRVQWPAVPHELQGLGNAGMIETAKRTPYAIAYVGISYHERARSSGLDNALLQNRAGAFVGPTPEAIRVTAESVAEAVPQDGRFSLVDTRAAGAYPLVNFEYAVVRAEQDRPGAAAALRDFLTWIVTPARGNDPALLAETGFAPLPERVRAIARQQIATIAGP